jgi:hypothetical protein
LLHVNHGVWLEEDDRSIQYFDVGEVHKLLVAYTLSGKDCYVLDKEAGRSAIRTPDQQFRSEVQLVGGIVPRAIGNFSFTLTYEPKLSIDETITHSPNPVEGLAAETVRADLIRNLSNFAEEGNQLLILKMNVDWPKARDWAARAEAYIRQHISVESAEYLSLATTEPFPGHAVNRDYVDWVHTRRQRLGEIASDIRSKRVEREIGTFKSATKPDLEFVNSLIIDRWIDPEHGLTEEGDEDSGTLKVKVLLARFYYKPDPGVPPRLFVKAHISFANASGVPIKARYDAVWHDEHDEYKEFDTADTHALIIALIADDDAIATLQYGRRPYPNTQYGYYFDPSSEALEGKEFRLRVELIGKRDNDVVMNKAFDFRLSLEPFLMKLV